MNRREIDHRYVERLLELPFVRDVRPLVAGSGIDAAVGLQTPRGLAAFTVEVVTGPVSKQAIGQWIARMNLAPNEALLVAAPHVPRPLGRLFAKYDLNFVDLAGNCRVRIGDAFLAEVEGRPAVERPRRELALRGAGYQVVLGLLVEPGLASEAVRTIATEVGVGKSVVADTLRALDQRSLVLGRGRKRMIEQRALARYWLNGYSSIVRPALLLGRYRVPDRTPYELERRIQPILGEMGSWAWGGAAAADRLLSHYRGDETVLHLLNAPGNLAKQLRAVPDPDGPLVVMRAPGPLAFRGAVNDTVHPLLVYAELLEGNERSREAGTLVMERYLGEFL